MANCVGIDLHRKRSHVAALDEGGVELFSRRIANEPDAFVALLDGESKIALEATYSWDCRWHEWRASGRGATGESARRAATARGARHARATIQVGAACHSAASPAPDCSQRGRVAALMAAHRATAEATRSQG